jgi:hypothetical protein
MCNLTISGNFKEQDIIDIGETSIMITPVRIGDIESAPAHIGEGLSSIFLTAPDQDDNGEEMNKAVVNKIAVTRPPQNRQDKVGTRNEINKIPKAFKELNNPKCKEYIDNMESLIEEIIKAKNK